MSETVKGLITLAMIISVIIAVFFVVSGKNKQSGFTLSPGEKEALSKFKPLVVGFLRDNPPFSYDSKAGIAIGMEIEAVRMIAGLLKIQKL